MGHLDEKLELSLTSRVASTDVATFDSGGSRSQGRSGVSVVCCDLRKTVAIKSRVETVLRCGGGGDSGKKAILNNVNLALKPGEVLGILGPSGGGKTTLLNMIAQRSRFGTPSGKVLYNGLEQDGKQVKTFTNYVMAHDKLLSYLTVLETLQIAAKLKLPLETPAVRRQRVEKAIKDMALNNCRDTYIGGEWKKGVSSGEMKRVSIGIELLDDPQLLLLDEPTSGLDSTLALEVMQVLANLASEGRTVVLTIHQPRSQVFNMIDTLILLNKGEVVYQGSPSNITTYFGDLGFNCPPGWNPADFVLDIISERDNFGSQLDPSFDMEKCTTEKESANTKFLYNVPTNAQVNAFPMRYQESPLYKAVVKDIHDIMANPGPVPSTSSFKVDKARFKKWIIHFGALWKRFTLNSFRNPVVCCVMVLVMALQGLILGGVFFQLPHEVNKIKPIQMDSSWSQNEFVKAYIHGIDGANTFPFVDIVRNGLDGNGSMPLLAMVDNTEFLQSFSTKVHCLHDKYGLKAKGYPKNLFKNPTSWPSRLLRHVPVLRAVAETMIDDIGLLPPHGGRSATELQSEHFEALENEMRGRSLVPAAEDEYPDQAQIKSDIITILQILDYLTLKADTKELMKCIYEHSEHSPNLLGFYGKCGIAAVPLLKPITDCMGYPDLGEFIIILTSLIAGTGIPSSSTAVPGSLTQAAPRSLMNMNTLDESTLDMLLSPEMVKVVTRTKTMIDDLTSCDNDVCKGFKKNVDFVTASVEDTLTSFSVVLNLAGCLFFQVANLGFASYDALLTFPQERAVFNHETANGLYGVSAYFLAKNIADLPFQILPSSVLATVYYWMVGLSATAEQFFVYYGICACMTFAAYGFGYLVSAASPRMEISVLIAPLTLVLWLTLAGFFLRDADIPAWIDWFKYLSFYRWGFMGLVTNQFRPGGYFGTISNEFVLLVTGITEQRMWVNALSVLALGVGFRIGCLFFLTFTNRKVGIER